MRKRLLWLMLFILGISTSLTAQNIPTVSGSVKDKDTGEELIGVVIRVLGSNNGTVTDIDGRFELNNVASDATIEFSYMGMETLRVKSTKEKMNIVMKSSVNDLEEVIVVGYGTSRKRDLTGSIVSIRGEELKTMPNNNAVKALQGKVPGLNVVNDGGAGSSPKITLRGIGTMRSNTNPLFVVDGMLLDNIDFVNANDIVSVEVLKDPSSLAIFGVQGANGVIIITTRRAESGKTSVKYDGYAGVQYLHGRDKLKLTNATQFTELYNEQIMNIYNDEKNSAIANGTPLPNIPDEFIPNLLGKGTDWQDEIIRPAFMTSHSLSVSKSSETNSSLLSLGYFKQDGIVKYNSYQRFNLGFAGDYKVNSAIKLGGNAHLSKWESDPATVGVANAAQAIPTYLPYRPEEEWDSSVMGSKFSPSPGIQASVGNPVAAMELLKGTRESYGYRGVGNIYAEISFLQNFMLKATGYFDVGSSYGSEYNPIFHVSSTQKREISSFKKNSNEYTKYQTDFILSYNKKIKEHSINATAGYTAHLKKEQGFHAITDSLQQNTPNLHPDLWVLDKNSKKIAAEETSAQEAFISYLARVNYSYANRYLFTASLRMDGSSKFSPNKRWGVFHSFGAGWVASEEQFMEPFREKIDFLKIKASYGRLGNDKINDPYYQRINPQGKQVIIDGKVYYIPTYDGIPDRNLHWEVMTGVDVGFESYFLNQRLGVDFGFYNKVTSDLLARVDVNASVGAAYAVTNAGSMQNRGVEFVISWKDRVGDFSYGASFNGSTISNKVKGIGNDDAPISTGSYHRTEVGYAVGSFYGYTQDGIFQTDQEAADYYPSSWTSKAGDIRYKDMNGDKKIDEKDRTFIGSSIPNFIYGINLNFGYKNFDLSLDFNGVGGSKIFNKKKLTNYTQYNYYKTDLDRWRGENTSNINPILNPARGHNYLFSTNLLEDGSYFRVRAVQLGYNIPSDILKKLRIASLRVYVNAQNLLTFKKNSGYTPEISGGILDGGVDNGDTYPLPTIYTGGITLSF